MLCASVLIFPTNSSSFSSSTESSLVSLNAFHVVPESENSRATLNMEYNHSGAPKSYQLSKHVFLLIDYHNLNIYYTTQWMTKHIVFACHTSY